MTTNAEAFKKAMAELSDKAEKLAQVRKEIHDREELYKKENEALWHAENLLKAELLEFLVSVNMKSIKVQSGDSFSIRKVPSFKVIDPEAYYEWAKVNNAFVPDQEVFKAQMKDLKKRHAPLPSFVEVVERDSIAVIKDKSVKEDISE